MLPRGIFYKITKNDKVSYLYGTMHLSVEECIKISTEAREAFIKADTLFVEMDLAPNQKFLEKSLLDIATKWMGEQRKLYGYLPEYSREQLQVLNQANLSHLVNHLPPVVIFHAFGEQQLVKKGLVRDERRQDGLWIAQAKNLNKPIIELDNTLDLLNAIAGTSLNYSEQLQCINLEYITSNRVEELMSAYLKKDLNELRDLSTMDQAIPACAKYKRKLLQDRDRTFSVTLEKPLEKGNAFIAVGVCHLPGLMQHLIEQGCSVEVIQESPQQHLLSTNLFSVETKATLDDLSTAMSGFNRASPMYQAALSIHQEALDISNTISESDLQKWENSMRLAINVLNTPANSPDYLNAVTALKTNASEIALGKSNGWKKFAGALTMLAGAAIIGLSIAGIPFTAGASLIGFYVAGSLLTVGGSMFCYQNRQKSLAKEMNNLAKESLRFV